MNQCPLTLFALAISVAIPAAQAEAIDPEPYSLLFPTMYHGQDITARDGDVYLAMVRDGEGWRFGLDADQDRTRRG